MKITAEFNSNEEFLSFINTFNTKTFISDQGTTIPVTPVKDIKPTVVDKKDSKKEDIPKVNAEVVGVSEQYSETVDAKIVKDEDPKVTKVTKEMVRAIFTKIIKAGKQKEAKALTAKYGASKIPEIKEGDYTAIYKEAEVLL